MSVQSPARLEPGFQNWIADVVQRIDAALQVVSAAVRTAQEVEDLLTLSDVELASRGLTRNRVVAHAFHRHMS